MSVHGGERGQVLRYRSEEPRPRLTEPCLRRVGSTVGRALPYLSGLCTRKLVRKYEGKKSECFPASGRS